MELLEKVLSERADELATAVQDRTGLSRAQARRLVQEAGDDLVASYRWQEDELPPIALDSPLVVRNVLGGMRGRAVAEKVGLPTDRTWDGIRALVPAVLESAARARR